MADLIVNRFITLNATTDDGTTLTWASTGNTLVNSSVVNPDADLDIGADYFFNTNTTFTGYTIEVDGDRYGVFRDLSNTYYVPYDSDFKDISGTFPSSGSTTGKTDNVLVANCFVTGTMIATPECERAIEDLAIGDLIRTHDGRDVVVKWVGRQTVATFFGPAERLLPVRVSAGALGDGLPHRDLTLTADHALLVDGLLITAAALVNDTTIRNVPLSEMGRMYTVYHIEIENHDILLAEGAPAETFIDYVGRQSFDNYAEYEELYGDDRTIPEMPYPRISARRLVPETLRARLSAPSPKRIAR